MINYIAITFDIFMYSRHRNETKVLSFSILWRNTLIHRLSRVTINIYVTVYILNRNHNLSHFYTFATSRLIS